MFLWLCRLIALLILEQGLAPLTLIAGKFFINLSLSLSFLGKLVWHKLWARHWIIFVSRLRLQESHLAQPAIPPPTIGTQAETPWVPVLPGSISTMCIMLAALFVSVLSIPKVLEEKDLMPVHLSCLKPHSGLCIWWVLNTKSAE